MCEPGFRHGALRAPVVAYHAVILAVLPRRNCCPQQRVAAQI